MLTLNDLKQAGVGIIGFGKEGQAVARFLNHHKLTATVFDTQNESNLEQSIISDLRNADFHFVTGKPLDSFSGCGILFRSPGVPRLHPALLTAEAKGARITSQTIWFFDACPASIIGVTGTKGKGTTTSLTAAILTAAMEKGEFGALLSGGTRVYVTGNIGTNNPLDLLPRLTRSDVVVFELSSFQLQDLSKSPRIGVCLMVTNDHLDHHKDSAEYRAAKSAIAAFQQPGDDLIFARDYAGSASIGELGTGRKFEFSRSQPVEHGAYVSGHTVELLGTGNEGSLDLSGRLLRGEHNMENIAAAAIVSCLAGASLQTIQTTSVSFPGLEHRLEFVGSYGGLAFYNDSISTVPESTIAAIQAFTEQTTLILGGSDKMVDFTELSQKITRAANIRGLILIGQTATKIAQALQKEGFGGVVRRGALSMPEVFQQLNEVAVAGDVVLLSPACASFDMFKNYADRGEQFKQQARAYGTRHAL